MALREMVMAVKKLDEYLTPGPIERFRNWHYGKIEVLASSLAVEGLKDKIAKYKKLEPAASVIITGLALVALAGTEIILARTDNISAYTVALLLDRRLF